MLAEEPLEVIDALVQLADLARELEQRLLVGAVLASPARARPRSRASRSSSSLRPGHARQDHVDQRAAAGDREVLRQPADAHAVRARDLAVVDLLLAGDDLEQRRLARAVRADQADPIAVAEPQARRVEDHPIAEEQRDVVEDDQAHERRLDSTLHSPPEMTYRDDRDADQARIEALEAELAAANSKIDRARGQALAGARPRFDDRARAPPSVAGRRAAGSAPPRGSSSLASSTARSRSTSSRTSSTRSASTRATAAASSSCARRSTWWASTCRASAGSARSRTSPSRSRTTSRASS